MRHSLGLKHDVFGFPNGAKSVPWISWQPFICPSQKVEHMVNRLDRKIRTGQIVPKRRPLDSAGQSTFCWRKYGHRRNLYSDFGHDNLSNGQKSRLGPQSAALFWQKNDFLAALPSGVILAKHPSVRVFRYWLGSHFSSKMTVTNGP